MSVLADYRTRILATLSRYDIRLPQDRMAALVNDLATIMQPARLDGWTPSPRGTSDATKRRKNPKPGRRVCSACKATKPLGEFMAKRDHGRTRLRPSSRCRDCLKEAARNRYVSVKQLAALNAVRLELVADDEIEGLRCLDCGEVIRAGDEVVAESGIRHSFCGGDAA